MSGGLSPAAIALPGRLGSLWGGILLAVLASVLLNGSYLLQHAGSAQAVSVSPRRPVATLRSLLRSPLWAVGAVAGMTGWALHIGALSRAPISIVQAFVAGGLALTLPLVALSRRRIAPAERNGAGLMVAGLVLLSIGMRAHAVAGPVPAAALAAYAVCAGLLAAGVTAAAGGAIRPGALGAAGGVFYGIADLAVKAVTVTAREDGVRAALLSPWIAVAVASSVCAFFAFQRGLQSGRPITVIALMTAATNLVSIAGGLLVLGDPLGATPALVAVHLAAFATIVAAAWRLAPVVA
jgi:hypothetical protein